MIPATASPATIPAPRAAKDHVNSVAASPQGRPEPATTKGISQTASPSGTPETISAAEGTAAAAKRGKIAGTP